MNPNAITRREFARATLLGGVGATVALVGHAQDGAMPAPTDFITIETQIAINRGLAYLARSQRNDGSYDDNSGPNAAIVGLAGLALMAGGHQPGRGEYGKIVSRAMDYLLVKSATGSPVGYINGGENAFQHGGGMYQHGFATLFLAELYGMMPTANRQRRLRDALEKATAVIVRSQNKLGGWRYDPRPSEADVSVTVAQLMALRAARNAGLFVPKSTIDAGVKYIQGCQLDDGGYTYMVGTNQGSLFPRSAAALVGLFSAGIYEGDVVDRSVKYLKRFVPAKRGFNDMANERYYYYAHYYAALAMWTVGGTAWAEWFPAIRDDLIARSQGPGNIWADFGHGPSYATAMACIILQLPNNYLPILQK